MKKTNMLTVILSNGEAIRNDYYGTVKKINNNCVTTKVNTLEDASKAIRSFIKEHLIGSSTFTGGDVLDNKGNKVASISYNGRIWLPGSKYFD